MYNTKNKTQSAYRKNKPTLNLIPKNCVCVFPIELVGGKTQVSNLGIMPNRRAYDKGSFLYWQEVFDGRSALKIQWEDSITLEKPERPAGVQTGYNYYLVRTQVGKYYYGKPISSGSEALEISEDASFEDFISMKASQTITLKFEYEPTDRESSKWELQKFFRFALVDNDMYNLYLIPEICEEKLMYIAEHQEYYDDLTGLAKGCEITFATLGDKIQKSGKAIEQYCAWNAPGEFSVRPQILNYIDEDGKEVKEVIINPISLYYPTPVKYLQVEQQGPALTSTIYALGRRQEWDETEQCWKIGPSKFLLPCDFIVTQPNPLNRSATPTKNFFCLPDEQVTMVTNAEVLKWIQDQATQPLEQVKNAGMISIGDNWVMGQGNVPTDNKSNPAGTGSVRKDYYDKSWFPLSYEGATTGPYDTTGCVYAGDSISFTDSDTMIDIMCKNAFIYNQQPIIPLSLYSTRPFYLRDIPIVGGIANFFKIGDIKLKTNTTSRKCSNLCYFGDADVMTMCANLNGAFYTLGEGQTRPTQQVFPINFFGTNENMYQKLGVNSANTTFCVALTDQVKIDGTDWDTIYLGQSEYEDSTTENPHYIFPETQQSLLVNSTLKPVAPETSNFIIDAVVVQSIFDGKIRLSCYGEEEQEFIYPQWTATILSNANWEGGNMRDWTNVFLLSNWEERFCVQQDEFVWPMPPHKKETDDYVLNINQKTSWEIDELKYWQDIQGNHWSKTTKVSDYTWKCSENITLYDHTLSYTDFGKEGVTNRDTFITYFGDMALGFDGSFVCVGNRQITLAGYNANINFSAGKYSYTQDLKLGSVRDYRNTWNLTLLDQIHDFSAKAENENLFVGARYNQNVQLTLTLEETQVRITIVDKSTIVGGGRSGVQSDKKIITGFCFVPAPPMAQKFSSTIQANKAVFHKR